MSPEMPVSVVAPASNEDVALVGAMGSAMALSHGGKDALG
jgi:hypothetical protein